MFGIMILNFYLVFISGLVSSVKCSEDVKDNRGVREVVFVILSQPNPIHKTIAEASESDIYQQAEHLGWPQPTVYLLHRDFPQIGGWTIFPILDRLFEKHEKEKSWLFFCEERTIIRLENLTRVFKTFNAERDWFIGKGIRDKEATIIHHFAFHQNQSSFQYPDFAAGFALSVSLLRKLLVRKTSFVDKLDFSIDAQHEFALFVWNDGKGVELTDVPGFCIKQNNGCATFFSPSKIRSCGEPLPSKSVFFAVKSCEKFQDRVSIILRTWGSRHLDLKFFTDSNNDSYPIVNLGIPNTERGHCSKTVGILNYVASNEAVYTKSWLAIVDDDTLLSVNRLLKILSCYDPSDAIALGERYGSRTASGFGYDYITGGGGMVFSMVTVKRLVESGICICPTANAPDDMFLGICLNRLGIPIVHSPHFHQARPTDYADQVLSRQEPVSFHKFWMIDPIKVYNEWLNVTESKRNDIHHEL